MQSKYVTRILGLVNKKDGGGAEEAEEESYH